MRTSRYEVFLKIVETQSLTRTAGYFGCTQSAVSQLVKALEAELGVSLFIRSKNGVRLTAEGEYLLPSMRQIVAGERSVFERSLELQNLNVGLIRIGIFTSLSCQWLPPHLKSFREAFPNIGFELLQGDVTQISDWLRNGMVDIGFMTPPDSDEFFFKELISDKMQIVLPTEHPLAGKKVKLRQLENETFVLLESGYSQTIDRIFQENDMRPKQQYTVKDDYTVMSMVESGLGVSLLPELVLKRTPFNLYTCPVDPVYERRMGVSWLKKDQNSVAVNKFVQHMLNDNID